MDVGSPTPSGCTEVKRNPVALEAQIQGLPGLLKAGASYKCEVKERQVSVIEADALHCLAQHLATFHRQAVDGEKADFAEPCTACRKVGNCRLDWLEKIGPICSEMGVAINLGRQGREADEIEAVPYSRAWFSKVQIRDVEAIVPVLVEAGRAVVFLIAKPDAVEAHVLNEFREKMGDMSILRDQFTARVVKLPLE